MKGISGGALSFLFVGLCFVLLIVSVFQPIETRVFINLFHMHFVGTKKRIFNPLVQLKEFSLLNRNKKEFLTTACEQLSSTEGAFTLLYEKKKVTSLSGPVSISN